MPLNLATFRTRTLSAIVFVVVMVVGMLWNEWSFFVLFSIVHFGCWIEYQRLLPLMRPGDPEVPLLWRIGFPLLGWSGMLWVMLVDFDRLTWVPALTAIIGILLIFAPAVFFLPRPSGLRYFLRSFLGLLYISVPWIVMLGMRFVLGTDDESRSYFWGPRILPCVLVGSIWINDTMQYLVGSLIGRTPFSSISPKKTWEGTVGGAILCVGVMTGLGYWTRLLTPEAWIIVSAAAAVFGTAGDLLESKLKRMAGVKDSGRILPGHGGFLDRFDSLLLAIPGLCLVLVVQAMLSKL